MDLLKYPRPEYSISHFRRPLCYELSGKELYLIMDNGLDCVLTFTDDRCRCRIFGREETDTPYSCSKADDTTYFVNLEISDTEDQCYVLDMQQRLVTQCLFRKGLNPKDPYMLDRQFIFGAIKLPGYRLPYKRHTFTSINQGTTVQWRWSPDMATKHAYLESSWYRITWDEKGEAASDFDSTTEMLPGTDEPAVYIKIKENMILLSLTEDKEEVFLGDIQHFRGDNLTLLQNFSRMYQVGRGFGATAFDGVIRPMRVRLASFGSPVELPEGFTTYQNPYTV